MLVHTLACESHIWFALPCLRSLVAFCEDPVQLVIHDDGSLTQASIDLLATAFPDSIFISRRSADAEMADLLARYPHIAEARRHLPHVIKLSDVTAIRRESATVCYVDTDVLFRKRFRGLFAGQSVSGAFLTDSGNSFGANPADFWPLGPLRLAAHLNSGLFRIGRDHIDTDRMEYLFKRWGPRRIRRYHGWFEQTVWADQAWRARCSMFDPTQLRTASPGEGPYSTHTGVHFVTPTRSMLKAALQADCPAYGNPPAGDVETIRLLPSQPYGLTASAADAMRAAAGRVTTANPRTASIAPREER